MNLEDTPLNKEDKALTISKILKWDLDESFEASKF